MTRFTWLSGLLCVGLLAMSVLVFGDNASSPIKLTDREKTRLVLQTSWQRYKQAFIQGDGRVMDPKTGMLTTSEGQSYALLRSVWMNDRGTFDTVYRWSVDNLRVRGDKLFAWKWGQKPDGSWGPLDKTAASDADQDIALALLMAHHRWGDERYRSEALPLLNDIWNVETAQTDSGRVLLPGDWHWDGDSFQVNPSYYAPYAYRIFAEADPAHPWRDLVNTSYRTLEMAVSPSKTHLPPDWVAVSRQEGSIRLHPASDVRSDFGYEAIRVYWRVALDGWLNPGEKRGRVLGKGLSTLEQHWKKTKAFPGPLTLDGGERKPLESTAIYGSLLPAFSTKNPSIAEAMLNRFVVPGVSGALSEAKQDYYAQNWHWMGLALQRASVGKESRRSGNALFRLSRLLD